MQRKDLRRACTPEVVSLSLRLPGLRGPSLCATLRSEEHILIQRLHSMLHVQLSHQRRSKVDLQLHGHFEEPQGSVAHLTVQYDLASGHAQQLHMLMFCHLCTLLTWAARMQKFAAGLQGAIHASARRHLSVSCAGSLHVQSLLV